MREIAAPASRDGIALDTRDALPVACAHFCTGRSSEEDARPPASSPRAVRHGTGAPPHVSANPTASVVDHPEDHAHAGDAQPAVRLEGLEKRFGDVAAVAGIDLEIADGEFFSMLGPSGSGKTTTLRMIAGFELPTAGRVLLHGARRHAPRAVRARREHRVPGLRAVPAHDGRARTSPTGCWCARCPRPSARRASPRRSGWSGSRATTGASRASSRAASGSGSPSRARS